MNENFGGCKKKCLPDLEGFPYVTDALMETINRYPGLDDEEKFQFSTILSEAGMTVIASSGASILDERESITGHVWQTCAYPFMVVYRASGLNSKRKIQTKEWLDTLAEWLCRKTVTINDQQYQLKSWPPLTGDRKILRITRQSAAFLSGVNEDKSENWVMNLVIQYQNEFDR